MDGLLEVRADTTATATFRTKDDAKPSRKKIHEALKPFGCGVKTLEKEMRPPVAAAFEVQVKGLR